MPDRISVRNFFQGFSSSLYSCIPLNIGRVGLTHVENSVKTNSQVFLSLFNTLYIYIGINKVIKPRLKGVFAKNERGYRLTAKNKRFWSIPILLLSVASIRRKLLNTTHAEEHRRPYKFRELQHSTRIVK